MSLAAGTFSRTFRSRHSLKKSRLGRVPFAVNSRKAFSSGLGELEPAPLEIAADPLEDPVLYSPTDLE